PAGREVERDTADEVEPLPKRAEALHGVLGRRAAARALDDDVELQPRNLVRLREERRIDVRARRGLAAVGCGARHGDEQREAGDDRGDDRAAAPAAPGRAVAGAAVGTLAPERAPS